jgi:RNA 2',3'-cyclic 3'-phosphodiesterase
VSGASAEQGAAAGPSSSDWSASSGSSGSSERARLFVAVRPPVAVVRALTSLRGADMAGVRWMGPEHWHVTLRFLGSVEVAPAVDALSRVAGAPGAVAVVGAGPVRLGREVLALPVDGLSRLAAAVDTAFVGLGRDPDHRPFRGHLTLARGTGIRGVAGPRLGEPMEWVIGTVSLVRSHLGRGGARYEDVAAVDLGPVLG